ncbi:MAG: hypothetical protein Q9O24_02635 [Gammaproteobacteria bacterium]|nr:hypothetical protein [Gammaproteobacteria bacterium]
MNNNTQSVDGVAQIDLINCALSRSEGVTELVYCLGELAEMNNSMDVVRPVALSSAAAVILEELKKIREHTSTLFDALCDAYRKNTPAPSLVGLNLPKTATGA